MRTHQLVVIMASISLAAACSEPPSAPLPGALEPFLAGGIPPYTPGEQQPSVDLTRGAWAIYPDGVGQTLAQTFKPSDDQRIGYLELPVVCTPGTLLNLKIRNAGRDLLFEANISGLPEVIDGSFQLVQVFDPGVTPYGLLLRQDRNYGFELAAVPGPGSPTPATCGIAQGPIGNTYRRGRSYSRDLSGGPAPYRPLPNGLPTDQEDLPFITLVLHRP